MAYSWFLIPVLSAFTGWFANWIAIRMLFHPREPRKILGITLQGVFPKKQRQIAEKLGKLVSAELLSFADIEQKITRPENVQQIMPLVEEHIDHFLRTKLPERMPVISMFIGDKTINELKMVFTAELETLFPVVMTHYMGHLRGELDLEKIIVERLTLLSSNKLEQVLDSIMSRELRFVGLIGAAIGFVIGLVQVLFGLGY